MSKIMADRYRKMIDAGTCDLAMIDAAEAKRFVTAAEAEELRTYWHTKYDPPTEGAAQADEQASTVSDG